MRKSAVRAVGEDPAQAEGTGAFVPAEFTNVLAYYLRLAQEASFRAFKQRVGSADLQPGRYAILSIIAHRPGLTPKELSLWSGRDKSTLTPALKDLERRGLITRKRSTTDERSYKVNLTTPGEALFQELHRHAIKHDSEIDHIVGVEQRAMFLEILRRITDTLSERGANAADTSDDQED
jgi:DNA-binding MarR family transcriptional regulator